jgi:hypothetical protein
LATSQNPRKKKQRVIMFAFGQFSDVAKVAFIHKKIDTNVEVHHYAAFFLLFMNEKKGVEWEGGSTVSILCTSANNSGESKGVVNCEGTKRAGKLWHVTLVVHSSRKLA